MFSLLGSIMFCEIIHPDLVKGYLNFTNDYIEKTYTKLSGGIHLSATINSATVYMKNVSFIDCYG